MTLLLAILALAEPAYTVRLTATVVGPPAHGWLLVDTDGDGESDTSHRCDLTHHDGQIIAVCPLTPEAP